MGKTSEQYNFEATACKEIFEKKMKDYGSAWRILRSSSLTDQLYIKAKRIRSLEEKSKSRVDEGIEGEYQAIVNYSIMGLIQLEKGYSEESELDENYILQLYNGYLSQAKNLMENKNHDYDEAWREMRTSSLTDMILQKLMRIRQIEMNDGKTLISEGLDANYFDMINYALFALIQLSEKK